jgi:hypothetical protein
MSSALEAVRQGRRSVFFFRNSLILFLVSLGVNTCWAGQFCAILRVGGKDCSFDSFIECINAKDSITCVVNKKEDQYQPTEGAPYCLDFTYWKQCLYYDEETCKRDAQLKKANCIKNPKRRKS